MEVVIQVSSNHPSVLISINFKKKVVFNFKLDKQTKNIKFKFLEKEFSLLPAYQ